jgi:hypothetical protein
MQDKSTRLGMLAIPVYGLLVFLSTLSHQPDRRADFHAYAEYITTPGFLVSHLAGSIIGTTIGIFGVLALFAVLAATPVRRLALPGLVLSASGMMLIMTLFGAATFAQPAIGRAYLAGEQAAVGIDSDVYGVPAVAVGVAGGLLYSAGAVLLGVAVWRAGTLPRWAGPLYAVAVPLIAIVGLAVGMAQPLGAVLLIVSGAWMTRTVWVGPVVRSRDDGRAQRHGSPTRPAA